MSIADLIYTGVEVAKMDLDVENNFLNIKSRVAFLY